MIETLLVYFTLTCTMLLLNQISIYPALGGRVYKSKTTNIPIMAILVFAIIFGIRYNVGIDHLRYIELYEFLRISGGDIDTEWGYLIINKFFAGLGLHYSYLFFSLAFLQLFLLLYSLRYNYKIVGWVILTFMLSTTFLNFMNGIRQELAFCFQTVALCYLSRKKIFLCYINIIFAILFHISAVILLPLPLFYLRKNNYFNNIPLQICLLIIFLLVSILFKPAVSVFIFLMDFLEVLGYEGYKYMVLGGDLSFLEPKRAAGLGFALLVLLNFINILQSNKIKHYHNSSFLNIIYDFYYVGILYNLLVSGSLALERVNYYFYNFGFVVSAFTLNYLYKNKNTINLLLLLLILMIYILLFGAVVVFRGEESCAIYNTCFK